MTYTFKNTEINNEKASIYETKSLLYLIGKSDFKKDVEYITFDCFNDVSGIDKNGNNIWDIQSKNVKDLNPKKIGKSLFTLFDNSISAFNFKAYIFYCQQLKNIYKIDELQRIYNYSNIEKETFSKIKIGLTEEVKRVKGESMDYSDKIDSFLRNVLIVEDDTTPQDYLKGIVKFKNKSLKNDEFYLTIFKELQNIQSAKKNSSIEGKTIYRILDVIQFERHLKTLDIDTFLICRIIGVEIFSHKSIPISFLIYIKTLSAEDIKDLMQECNSNLSRCLFNKTSNKEFWKICEMIICYLTDNYITDIEAIFLVNFNHYKPKYSYLDPLTIKYLIALIIEGFK